MLDIGVGKQQLVEIAKALSKEVRLLILDEPTAALNDEDSAHLLDLLRGLRDEGITCVIISHKLNEVAAIADSITILRDGRTIETLSTWPRARSPRTASSPGWSAATCEHRFPPHEPRDRRGGAAHRGLDGAQPHPARPRVVVAGPNLTLRRGEIVGLAGLMGAGRTELAMSVFGRSYGVDISGRIFKDGKQIELRTVRDAISHGIAYATEDRKRYGLNLIEDIKRNVSAAALAKLAQPRLGQRQRGVPGRRGVPREHEHQGAERRAASPGKLSGGNQQKVVLSKWIFTDPDVLILDEPTRGHRRRREVRDLHDHQPARGRGQGDPRHLLGAARAARALRPDLRAVRRADHR